MKYYRLPIPYMLTMAFTVQGMAKIPMVLQWCKMFWKPCLRFQGILYSILDSGDPARPGRPAKTGNILDYEPKLRTHHAGWAD